MPLHPDQHAYQTGNPWKRPFISLISKKQLWVFFLDIAGAYSHTFFHTMCVVLVTHRVGYTTVPWIKATLEGSLAMGTLEALSQGLQCPGVVDVMRPAHNIEPMYRVTMLTTEEWNIGPGTLPAFKGLVWYTNQSRTRRGTGVGVNGQYSGRRLSITYNKNATVFQAEIYAILACA